jgi:hypothetical protein
MAAPCIHGNGQRASNQCAVTRNLYIVVGCSNVICAVGAVEAVYTLEANFCYKLRPYVACGCGFMPMAATGSCCMLGLSLFHG